MYYKVLGDDLMLHYCKKCGRVAHESYGRKEQSCDCCKSIMYPVPNKYLWDGFDENFKDKESEQLLIEELIKTSPEFDQYLFDHRDEILAKQSAEFDAKMAHGKAILEEQSRVPKCPICQSTNIRKMGGIERGASIYVFGIFSKKINKTFKCQNCGYTW